MTKTRTSAIELARQLVAEPAMQIDRKDALKLAKRLVSVTDSTRNANPNLYRTMRTINAKLEYLQKRYAVQSQDKSHLAYVLRQANIEIMRLTAANRRLEAELQHLREQG